MSQEVDSLLQPWVTYYNKLRAMFAGDPDIELSMEEYTIYLKVKSLEKTTALKKLLYDTIEMGSVVVKVIIYFKSPEPDIREVYEQAFKDNPVFIGFKTKASSETDNPKFKIDYCIFKKEVIQFFNDEVNDFFGNYNGLMSDIAIEVMQKKYHVGYSINDIAL